MANVDAITRAEFLYLMRSSVVGPATLALQPMFIFPVTFVAHIPQLCPFCVRGKWRGNLAVQCSTLQQPSVVEDR